jgi:2-iminobutanoate/2-iminopropanoate deaminase
MRKVLLISAMLACSAPAWAEKFLIESPDAPKAIGPYSQAIRAGSLLFLSGQIPIDPATGQMVDGDIAQQTHRVFKNLEAILTAAGASFDNVVRTTVYLADMSDFAAMNEVYGTYFSSPAPARATVQAARLPMDARVEIDLIASV